MLNRVTMVGRMVRDPELKTTQSGVNVSSFSVAVQRNYKNANGEYDVDFFDAVAWRNTAEFICTHFRKGSMISFEGRLETRKYTDKNGNNRTAIEIILDNAFFCEGKRENAAAEPAAKAAASKRGQPTQNTADGFDPFGAVDDGTDFPPFPG